MKTTLYVKNLLLLKPELLIYGFTLTNGSLLELHCNTEINKGSIVGKYSLN